jgi:electron transfer flavoprotein beta subunit
MKIVVCIKQVVDPEMPYSAFKVDPAERRVIPPQGTPPVLSPFDENALEAALRIKDNYGANVIALSLGNKLSRPVLTKALAAGADELILIEDIVLDNIDSFASADILAAAIRRIGDVDMVLTGRQAADWDSGITGCAIAEELDIPCITLARKVDVGGMMARVERVLPDGFEVIELPIPCVITVDSDLGELRPITLQGLSEARKKPVQSWELSSLNSVSRLNSRCQLLHLYLPVRETICEIIEGESMEDAAINLANRLHKESLI